MADNIVLNPGAGGDTTAADDIGGVKYQRVKLSVGADGSAADAASGGGVEAGSLRVTIASDSTGVLSVDDNGSTLSIDDGAGSITVDGTVAVSGTVAVTDNSGSLTVDGTVELGATTLAALESTTVVDGGGSITVDGTVAATQSGTWNVGTVTTVTNSVTVVGSAAEDAAAAGNPVLVGGRYDSSARTLETGDAGALALNASGQLLVEIAAGAGSGGTAAADDADFTAGTTSGTPVMGSYQSSPTAVTDGDMGIIGITSSREVKVSVTSGGVSGKAEDAAHTTGDEGIVVLAVRRDSAAVGSGTDGDYSTINVDASGRVWCNVANTVTVGSHAVTNAGTFAVQVDGSALTALQLIDNTIVADDAAFTVGTTSVNVAGFFADESATDSVDEGDAGAARMTLDRKQIVTLYAHAAAGGQSAFRSLDVDETEDEVKASAGKLFWLHAINLTAAVVYLKVYNNTAAGTTVGTTTPVYTFPIPTLGDTNGAGFTIHFGDTGVGFSTGICVAGLTGIADNDTTGVGTNGLVVNAGYA